MSNESILRNSKFVTKKSCELFKNLSKDVFELMPGEENKTARWLMVSRVISFMYGIHFKMSIDSVGKLNLDGE